jgi:hypothetical protein
MLSNAVLGRLAMVVPLAAVLFWLALAIVHVAFAVAVYRHSTAFRGSGRRLVFAGPELWTLATLVSGVLGVAAYWLIHCSTLAIPEAAPAEEPARNRDSSH